MMKPGFKPGRNMAMKIPPHEYEQTVMFYRDILGLKDITPAATDVEQTPRFEFGDKVLWLDCVAGISQAEIWLEIVTDDIEQASAWLHKHHCVRRDEIEPLPEDFRGFWFSNPANIIHLVSAPETL